MIIVKDNRQTFYHRINRDITNKVSDDWLFMVHSFKKKERVFYFWDSCIHHVPSLAVVRPTIGVIISTHDDQPAVMTTFHPSY
jgi:hypothetical protein